MVFSEEDKIFLQNHIITLSIHCYMPRGIKIGAHKMQFVYFLLYLLDICSIFKFLISKDSVATCLRSGGYVVYVL